MKRKTVDISTLSTKEWREFEATDRNTFVIGNDDARDIERAVAIPDVLYSKDGRAFPVRGWKTTAKVDELLIIEPELFVSLPDE